MEKVRLVYRETAQSEGEPQLEDPTGKLSRDELRSWQTELARRYQQLAQSDGQVITFSSSVADLPSRYRVRIRPVKNRRCPVVELVEVEENAEASAAADLPEWLPAFVEGAESLLRNASADRAQRAALTFVLDELRELDQVSRPELTALHLAGYLHMAESQCAGLENASERVAFYRLASRVIDAWCRSRSADPKSVPRPTAGEAGARFSYQWMPRVLARLLGLKG